MEILPDEDWEEIVSNPHIIHTLDIDHIGINLTVSYDNFAVFNQLIGNTVQLSTWKTRHYRRNFYPPQFQLIVFAYYQCIIETEKRPNIKQEICDNLSILRHQCIPAPEDMEYLLKGHGFGVPTMTFMEALRLTNVRYIRLVNYGMKQNVITFPDISTALADCSGRVQQQGYPENIWDVGYTNFDERMYCLKVDFIHRARPGTTIDAYPLFTPLDRRPAPRANHGGTFMVTFEDDVMPRVKVYNESFHFLRTSTSNHPTYEHPHSLSQTAKHTGYTHHHGDQRTEVGRDTLWSYYIRANHDPGSRCIYESQTLWCRPTPQAVPGHEKNNDHKWLHVRDRDRPADPTSTDSAQTRWCDRPECPSPANRFTCEEDIRWSQVVDRVHHPQRLQDRPDRSKCMVEAITARARTPSRQRQQRRQWQRTCTTTCCTPTTSTRPTQPHPSPALWTLPKLDFWQKNCFGKMAIINKWYGRSGWYFQDR